MNETGMEVDEIENQGCKFARISNGFDSNKGDKQYGDVKRSSGLGGLCGWPSSSRIVRVSRASGGKDRHSKVLTSKGLRDRRVRLSVNTAIQFYDLQDRLGYDQPSKAVEWLLKAAAPSISELPSLDGFPDAAEEQISEDKRSSAEQGSEMEGDPNYQHQPHEQLSKSACSSTSETSKGSSGLSLSRSESRVKARERARERAVEKEKENESSRTAQHHNMTSSFTELLTGGMTSNTNANPTSNGSGNENKSPQQWSLSPFELLGLRGTDNSTSGLQAQIHLGNAIQQQEPRSVSSPMFSITGDHHPELHHFPFVNDHLVTAAAGETNSHGNNHYNLNFSISSSSLAGYNRGTLQSNSSSFSSLLPPFQRYSPVEGSQSFFNGNHQHFLSAYDARLQLFYGDGQHSDVKGKGKN